MQLFDKFLGTFFLTASFQGLVIACLLYIVARGNKMANRVLSVFVILFSIEIFYFVGFWSQWGHINKFLRLAEGFALLYGPLLYTYFHLLESPTSLKKFKWHFLPYLSYLVLFSPFILNLFTSMPTSVLSVTKPIYSVLFTILYFAKLVSVLVYAFLILKYFYFEKLKINSFATDAEKVKVLWVSKISFLFSAYATAYLGYILLEQTRMLKPEYDYAIGMMIAVILYVLAYQGFRQPGIFMDLLPVHSIKEVAVSSTEVVETIKYSRNRLSESFIKRCKDRLTEMVASERPYLKKGLKIQDMAEMMHISSHQLSQVINLEYEKTFTEYINQLRVEHAIRLIEQEPEGIKIFALALDSGFSNKVSFYNAFKRHTGMSPVEFKGKLNEKNTNES